MKTRTTGSSSRLIRRLLIFAWTALVVGSSWAQAAPVETLVQDTLYRADGKVAHGTLTIRWNGFTSGGQAVAAGEMTVKTDANGGIAIPLMANTGASPSGSYYRVFMKLDDGLKAHMRWIVGNGNEGKIQELEIRIQKHEAALQRTAGLGAAAAVLLTIVHLALDSLRVMHH
jgi:hypothetical protein